MARKEGAESGLLVCLLAVKYLVVAFLVLRQILIGAVFLFVLGGHTHTGKGAMDPRDRETPHHDHGGGEK